MKFKITICFLLLYSMSYAAIININHTYTSSITFNPFSSLTSISGLSLNGSVSLNSDTSLFRVILVDNVGNEYIVAESYSMIVDVMSYTIANSSDETALLYNITPVSLKIVLVNASLNITFLTANTTVLTSTFSATETQRLQNIANNNIVKATNIRLYQNAPNLFKESTTIKLEIPESVGNAMVCIYDLTGRQLKCLGVSGRGTTSIQIFGNELTAGLYHYALIADGNLIDTKTMILTN